MDYSPALSASSITSDMTDEELDKYFASYVPLSNLPTPPPARGPAHKPADAPTQHIALPQNSPATSVATHVLYGTPELEAYAMHLANLVPLNVSSQTASAPVIKAFLERADLPVQVIAFAACVLDALSQRFASSWRDASLPPLSSFHTFCGRQQPVTGPEAVVLSTLVLAHGFLDDAEWSNSRWARVVGASQFTVKEIERTKRCILQDMDYRLFRITETMVQRMMRDMQRAVTFSSTTAAAMARRDSVAEKEERRPKLSLDLQGTAVWQHGVQTPEPSP